MELNPEMLPRVKFSIFMSKQSFLKHENSNDGGVREATWAHMGHSLQGFMRTEQSL